MRSRDGNHDLTLRLCSIILFSSLTLNAGEYLISYKYFVKDALLYNETLLVSKAMKKCSGTVQNDELLLKSNGVTELKSLILQNIQEFTDFVQKLGLQVEHGSNTASSQTDSTTTLTLRTMCFKVDFNDNFAIMAPFK